MSEDKNEDNIDATVNAGLAAAAHDVVSRYGGAVKEHIVAYTGLDNETGQELKRSLKKISQYGTDPANRESNIKQQAGFAAETKEVARQRAEQQIRGETPIVTRTDDIPGHVNDELYDITCEVDAKGDPVPGASAQMKFVGSSPHAAVDKMLGNGYQKYIDNDCKMMVPSDYYEGMKADLTNRMSDLREQIEYLKSKGRNDLAEQKQALLEKCKKLDRNLEKSSVSNDEAKMARLHPGLSTAEDMLWVAHRAGVEQMKMGGIIGGGISLVKNAIGVFNGEKTKKEAALDLVGDTTSAAGLSYVTAFGGSLVKGTMQNAGSGYVRTLAKTSLPAFLATSTLEVGKTLSKYFRGKIDGVQCLDELGEKGYGMVNAAMYGTVGQLLIPVPVVGALAGSMIGYALSSASYKILFDSLKAEKLAHEERIRVERECAEAKKMLEECRLRLEIKIENYLKDKRDVFEQAFAEVKRALEIGDADGYVGGMNEIAESFGKKPLFHNLAELDTVMSSEAPIVL